MNRAVLKFLAVVPLSAPVYIVLGNEEKKKEATPEQFWIQESHLAILYSVYEKQYDETHFCVSAALLDAGSGLFEPATEDGSFRGAYHTLEGAKADIDGLIKRHNESIKPDEPKPQP